MIVERTAAREIFLADEGLPEVANWLAVEPHHRGTSDAYMRKAGKFSWDLGAGWSGAVQMARDGWSKGAEMIARDMVATFPRTEHGRQWRSDVAGDLPDVARFLAGDPAHMRRRGRDNGRTRVVGLAVNIGIIADINAKQQQNFGLAMCSCIDALESSGTRVELYAASTAAFYENGSKPITYGWRVKAAEDALDLSALAFSLAHPAAHRRIGFAMRARASFVHSMGASAELTQSALPSVLDHIVCIGGIARDSNACMDYASAVKFCTRQINKAAGEELVSVED